MLTPYNQQPITVLIKAVKQKVFRQLHCLECGRPFLDITDKILSVSDSVTPIEQLNPDEVGIIEAHCSRHDCKQYYRMEFAR